MASVKDSGSQTATVTTEHTLSTVTDPGTYVLAVDIDALAAGESVELRVYGKARTGDTERLLHRGTYGPTKPSTPLVMSVPIVSPHYFKATLKQITGSSRAYPWAVYEV